MKINSCEFEYRVSLGPSHGSAHVVAGGLSAVAAVQFSQHDEGDEDEDEQDDRHSDPHLDEHNSRLIQFIQMDFIRCIVFIVCLWLLRRQRECHETICPPHSRPFFSGI